MPNPWALTSIDTNKSEIDLRKHIKEILHGAGPGTTPKGTPFLLRKARFDDAGKLVVCSCRGSVAGESPKNVGHRCRFCDGEGFLWDDTRVIGYLSWEFPQENISEGKEYGRWSPESPLLYLEYYHVINLNDIIIEPVKDAEGVVLSPIQIKKRFNILSIHELRGDYGRIEYFRLRLGEKHNYA